MPNADESPLVNMPRFMLTSALSLVTGYAVFPIGGAFVDRFYDDPSGIVAPAVGSVCLLTLAVMSINAWDTLLKKPENKAALYLRLKLLFLGLITAVPVWIGSFYSSHYSPAINLLTTIPPNILLSGVYADAFLSFIENYESPFSKKYNYREVLRQLDAPALGDILTSTEDETAQADAIFRLSQSQKISYKHNYKKRCIRFFSWVVAVISSGVTFPISYNFFNHLLTSNNQAVQITFYLLSGVCALLPVMSRSVLIERSTNRVFHTLSAQIAKPSCNSVLPNLPKSSYLFFLCVVGAIACADYLELVILGFNDLGIDKNWTVAMMSITFLALSILHIDALDRFFKNFTHRNVRDNQRYTLLPDNVGIVEKNINSDVLSKAYEEVYGDDSSPLAQFGL